MKSFYGTEKNNKKNKIMKNRNRYLSSVLDWNEGPRDLVGRYDCL